MKIWVNCGKIGMKARSIIFITKLQHNMTTEFNPENVRTVPSKEHIYKLVQLARDRVERGCFLKPGTYQRYMDYLRTKPATGVTEKHHIIPKHMQGSNDPSNLIRISVRHHILAHLLLYLEEGGPGNLLAYTIRQSSQHIDLRSQSKLSDFMNKTLKKGWYNSKVQSELGKKGGRKGGTRNTLAQWAARSQVGQTYGRSTGLLNQSEALRNILQTTLVFEHKGAPGQQIIVCNQESVVDLARYLNLQCDILPGMSNCKLDLDKVKRGGPFYGLLKTTKKSAYGWVLLATLPLEEYDD